MMKILEQSVVYADDLFYAAFPSVVCCPDGELIAAFRRAPDRRIFGAVRHKHIDPNSYLVLVRSQDNGKTWTGEPELIHAHALGGSQDPCMTLLGDGSLLVASYLWVPVAPQLVGDVACGGEVRPVEALGMGALFLGGYLMRSQDQGAHWDGPIELPAMKRFEPDRFAGLSVSKFNRGNIIEGSDATLYWAVRGDERGAAKVEKRIDLLVSTDKGNTWEVRSPVVDDPEIKVNEAGIVETAGGDLIVFLRTRNLDDHGIAVRSRDRGQTWEPWQDMGLQGHPYFPLRLPDGRIFLIYGYRHEPYGVRARMLDPEVSTFGTEEIVLRDDGGSGDLGYPWACMTADGTLLAVYYINTDNDGPRRIEATRIAL
jgi:hypothetical protein